MRSCLMSNCQRRFFRLLVSACAGILAVLYASCATAGDPPRIDYSDEKSILYEIETASKTLNTDPLEGLVRSRALLDNTNGFPEVQNLFNQASERSRAEFDIAVAAGRWSDALVLFRSLKALGIAPLEWSEALLLENRLLAWKNEGNLTLAHLDEPVQSTPEDEAPPSVIVSNMIKGTVTVWVDKGLRIENGVGYADRVIGSGFFIDHRGYLITNYHVIESEVNPEYEGYSRLFIKTGDDPDARIPARVIGWDPVLDIALLKTEIKPQAVFSLGTSEDLKIGNRIYAIGSPAGLEQTLTSGIVSAQKRRLLSLGNVLQIDAPINHGNSGGPIVDEAGRVQAVVFAGIEPYEGLNFAIPVEFLRIILPALYAGGKVTHPWTGSFGKTAQLAGSTAAMGVSVVYTLTNGPLSVAGMPAGTVVTSVNGVRVRTLEELQGVLIRERPGTIIKIAGIPPELLDESRFDSFTETEWYIRLSQRPELPGKKIFTTDVESRALLPVFGLDVERVGTTKKYLVRSVVRGSIADESGFSEQDVVEIREVLFDDENKAVSIQLYTKRRKSGYLDAFIGLAASLDSPSYF
ncbi:MAG: putative periplasmic serine endoprotease DegP-like precursor [Spirochaetes bacterium ADurb.Bin269]|nr:MAG: putative periplasmic serine endoprotease DegP-like precursor [Spirochaetes bacterium ADurb.Bin269]